MNTQLTFEELDSEAVAMLPSKETLSWGNSWTSIYASNSSLALNASTYASNAASLAVQQISVSN
jgi:hypothetical protein